MISARQIVEWALVLVPVGIFAVGATWLISTGLPALFASIR